MNSNSRGRLPAIGQSVHSLFCQFLAMKLKRDVQSALFLFLLLLAFLAILEWFHIIPQSGGSIKLNPIAGTGLEISYETSKGHSESVAVISVPAYRMATPTGIFLRAGDSVTVSASGIVATSSAYDWFAESAHTNQPGSHSNVADEIQDALRLVAFNRNSDPDWRDPDGNRLYGLAEENYITNTPLHEAHETYKLLPKENYGLLLGCVLKQAGAKVDNLQLIDQVLQARTKGLLFAIGQRKMIQCLKEDGNRMRLRFPPNDHDKITPDDIVIDGSEGQLVLLVNDVIFSSNLLANLLANTNATAEDKANYDLTKRALWQSKLARQMDPAKFGLFATELWFWDNNGSFTAMIKRGGND